MNLDELNTSLEKGIYKFYNKEFTENIELFDNTITRTDILIFENCVFQEISIYEIKNPYLTIKFHRCIFESDLKVIRCSIYLLQISSLIKIKDININYGKFNFIDINSDSQPIYGNIKIHKCIIDDDLKCSELYLKKGQLTLDTKEQPLGSNFNTSFQNSTIDILNLSYNKFNGYFNFKNTKILTSSIFDTCTFKSIQFKETDLGHNCLFNNCSFENLHFLKCKNILNTHLTIKNSLFTNFSHFNESKLNNLKITHTTFEKKASFDSVEVNIINLNQVTFLQGAYFDDIKINKIEDCDRKTIRTIKQELQKAENRIDFNRFRAYELAAHYKELDWKWESGFIDKSILFITKISTDFGNSWRKALRFTIVGGFLIYLVLYIIENREFSIDFLNWNNWERLLSGFFRFLLVTDFYNPLETDRIYLTNPLSWLILIFGKTVIAFGIYEMIQSFRKFKA